MRRKFAVSAEKDGYLRVDLLQPADVILTRPGKLVSKASAKLTSGAFSHAAVAIASTLHFESDDKGVGYTRVGLSKVEQHPDGSRWFWNVSHYRRVGVFRHPDFNKLTASAKSTLASHLQEILHPFAGTEYPTLDALANATAKLAKYPKVKEGILKLLERMRSKGQKKVLPGPFCSELVALAFKELGHPIFPEGIEPAQVSPNLLADDRVSRLRPLSGVLVRPDPRLQNDDEGLSILSLPGQPTGQDRSMTLSHRKARVAVTSIDLAWERLIGTLTQANQSIVRKKDDT